MLKKLLTTAFFLGSLFICYPAEAAISYITSQGCTGTSSCTTGSSVQAGDLLIASAFRDGNSTAPTVAAGWTAISNGAAGNSNGMAVAYKSAAGGAEASGTFTSATSFTIEVYRGATIPGSWTGGFATAEGTGGTITVPGTNCGGTLTCNLNGVGTTFAFTTGDGTSWVFSVCGHRQVDTDVDVAISGLTARTDNVDATDELATFDSNAGVSSFTGNTKTLSGTNGGWHCKTVEIQAAAAAVNQYRYTTLNMQGVLP